MQTYKRKHDDWFWLGMVLLWLGSAMVPAVHAQPNSEPRLELDELLREALERNPDIHAARQRWEAAKAMIPQARSLPDPMVRFSYERVEEREWRYGVSQEFPFPGKLRLRGEIAARDAERMEQEYLAVPLRVLARLKEAFYDLAFVHTAIDIVLKSKLLLQNFEQTAQARYAVGRGVQQDIFRAQAELSRLLARLATLEQRKASLHADINRLLNRPPSDPLGSPSPLVVTPRRYELADLNALIDASPLLRTQQKSVERTDQTLALAKREYYPDFEVEIHGIRNETTRKNGYELMLGVKVPLYYVTKQRAGVRESLSSREAAVQDTQAVKQDLLFRLKDNFVQAQRAEQLMTILTNAIIPQARLTLEAAQAGYAVGKVDFLTLLSSLLTLQDNELELHAEIAEHEKALARLEEILGSAP
jgi:outer membrane protein TolC